jgi:L-threonylcarbamoyladenylate synthase
MLDKHYAPRARVVVADAKDVAAVIAREVGAGRRVGAMVVHASSDAAVQAIVLPDDARGYAARLYDALHSLDDHNCDVIVVERVPGDASWMGVADRIRRAATA